MQNYCEVRLMILVPSKRRGYAMLAHENFPPHNQRAARKTHDNEKGAPSHRNSESLVHNAPLTGNAVFTRIFSKLPTGKPDGTWKPEAKNLRTISICKRRCNASSNRIISCWGRRCKAGAIISNKLNSRINH